MMPTISRWREQKNFPRNCGRDWRKNPLLQVARRYLPDIKNNNKGRGIRVPPVVPEKYINFAIQSYYKKVKCGKI